MRRVPGLVERVRAEYLEMPGMSLTIAQVQRLCGIEHTLCQTVLDRLVDSKFLCVTPKGLYARAAGGIGSRPQPAIQMRDEH